MSPRRKKKRETRRRLTLNISGEIYETYDTTLRRFPESLLGDVDKRRMFYCSLTEQYYFNRTLVGRLCFDSILYFYQSNGVLVCPPQIPLEIFREECNFFQLPYFYIDRMMKRLDPFGFIDGENENSDNNADGNSRHSKNQTFSEQVWDILENPRTSRTAKVSAFISLSVVMLSVVTSTVETIPSLSETALARKNQTNHWLYTDLAINIYFLIEFIARVVFCPNKLNFVLSMSTWLDGIAVIPYFAMLLASDDGLHKPYHYRFLRLPRFVRILRLFRLSDYSRRLRIVEEIFKSSFKDIQLLLMCMLIVASFGGSVMYVVEEHWNPVFTSNPQSLWWAVTSITTVGYGDIIPQTFLGKIVATCVMVFGAGTMTLPILGIVTKFTSVYSKFLAEEHRKRKEKDEALRGEINMLNM